MKELEERLKLPLIAEKNIPTQAPRQPQTDGAEANWTKVVRRRGRMTKVEEERTGKEIGGRDTLQPPKKLRKGRKKGKQRKLVDPKTTAVTVAIRPEAEHTQTYAEILGKIRKNVNIEEMGIESVQIRQTATGARVIEVPGADSDERADKLATRIREILPPEMVWVARPHKSAELRIVGLDDSITSQDVAEGVAREGEGAISDIKAGEIRTTKQGMRTCWVRCPVGTARKLMEKGSIIFGWAKTRVELLARRRLRCHRCLELGHVRQNCTEERDRSTLCYRCGVTGHVAARCNAKPNCPRGAGGEHLTPAWAKGQQLRGWLLSRTLHKARVGARVFPRATHTVVIAVICDGRDPPIGGYAAGAGKTTFLVCLGGRCTLPSEGEVTIRGCNIREHQDVVEIVPQFEVFMNSLTVMEHLIFMIEIKLGSWKKPSNKFILNSLIMELKLSAHTQTSIESLSGGERRLLSIATSLLSNPQILICDEPTTGLDSYNALLVVGILKKLSMAGKTVICSVHQPSSDLFKEFSSILLMVEGRLLFHGSHDDCKEVFASIHLHCPENYNPAEFYIRTVFNLNNRRCEEIMESYRDRSDENNIKESVSYEMTPITKRHWLKQVHLLLWRSSKSLKRSVWNYIYQLFVGLTISSIALGTCYTGVSGINPRGIQDMQGLLWLLTSEIAFSLAYNALNIFGSELALFKREVGMYDCSAYLVATFLCFLPRCILWTSTHIFLATIAVELPNHVLTAMEFITALFFTGLSSVAFGLGMGALFISTGLMDDLMSGVDLPLMLVSGVFLQLTSLPGWLYPIKYLSHFYYGMDALSNIYWRQINHIDCPVNTTDLCIKDGSSALIYLGYSNNFILQDTFGLFFVLLIWSTLAYYGLKREEKKGYVY
ncbi:protein scarlet [Aphomia sociella]